MMELNLIETSEEARRVFPVMKELRESLNEDEFVSRWAAARAESGYRLYAAMENGVCTGLMGVRVLTDFVHGRHLYVDDLVVASRRRSGGLGSLLLAEAKKIAVREGCARLRLCTGVQNERGRSFYERNGWDLRAVVYKTNV